LYRTTLGKDTPGLEVFQSCCIWKTYLSKNFDI